MEKILETIARYDTGLLTQSEMDNLLNDGIMDIHGVYDPIKRAYTGYNYKKQEWILFDL